MKEKTCRSRVQKYEDYFKRFLIANTICTYEDYAYFFQGKYRNTKTQV